MIRSARNSFRLLRIALIFAWEGALPFRAQSKRKTGEGLARAFERLGPTFIKLGQALSTRSDLVGEEVADALSGLRDRLPPFPTAIARKVIEEDLGAPIASYFRAFEGTPVAAASIAQVHKAELLDGTKVAIKVLRPRIEAAFARDLDLFFWIAEMLDARLANARRFKPLEVIRTFKETVFFELDLRFEAAASNEMEENLKRHPSGLRVPRVHWGLTSRRVLVCDWVGGISFSDMERIRASGHDLDAVLAKAATSLFLQVFRDGFFHADLHPGNLFLDPSGDLVAVDFGIMGRLDLASRVYIAEILRGFLTQDYAHVAKVHFDAGYVPATKSHAAFTQACRAVAQPIMGKPLNEISVAKLLGQMFSIAAEFEMETQPQLLLMQKTMMVAEGVGRMLNPNLNMWELARPLIEQWAGEQFGLKAKAKQSGEQLFYILKEAPHVAQMMQTVLARFSSTEGLKIHPDSLASLQHARLRVAKQWLWLGWSALFVAIFGVLAFAA